MVSPPLDNKKNSERYEVVWQNTFFEEPCDFTFTCFIYAFRIKAERKLATCLDVTCDFIFLG
jgi:hypothetical protein